MKCHKALPFFRRIILVSPFSTREIRAKAYLQQVNSLRQCQNTLWGEAKGQPWILMVSGGSINAHKLINMECGSLTENHRSGESSLTLVLGDIVMMWTLNRCAQKRLGFEFEDESKENGRWSVRMQERRKLCVLLLQQNYFWSRASVLLKLQAKGLCCTSDQNSKSVVYSGFHQGEHIFDWRLTEERPQQLSFPFLDLVWFE